MTNINAPFGLRCVGLLDGGDPTFGIQTLQISSTNASAAYTGDVLLALSGGYTTPATAASASASGVVGVALGFEWISKAFGGKVWRPTWQGATTDVASGNVSVKAAVHPHAVFEVQALGGPIVQSNVGQNANINVGAGGNTLSGISSYTIDNTTLSGQAALPFRIYEVPGAEGGSPLIPPFDPTNQYNVVKVVFNPSSAPVVA